MTQVSNLFSVSLTATSETPFRATGATQGPGERASEAYWRYFAGRLPDEIRQIIDASPAFETLRQELEAP